VRLFCRFELLERAPNLAPCDAQDSSRRVKERLGGRILAPIDGVPRSAEQPLAFVDFAHPDCRGAQGRKRGRDHPAVFPSMPFGQGEHFA
jgi:hypothetical protein